MSSCPHFDHLVVMPHLRVQNANAISSPLTHGFPSMTAFLGLMWALERKARSVDLDLSFKAVGVVCHWHQEQVTDSSFVKSFRLTRNPIDKDGSTAAIVEEGRIHLEVSIVFATTSERWQRQPERRNADLALLTELLTGMRVAGGSVLPASAQAARQARPWFVDLTGTEDDRLTEFRKARMRLLPGFALVSRDDVLEDRVAELHAVRPNATRLEAWLSLSRTNWRYESPEDNNSKGAWRSDRKKGQGWLVPIPVGYGALSEVHAPGTVANARDELSPFQFVESLYSVGQWVSPHRIPSPQQMLWYQHSDRTTGIYRCANEYISSEEPFEDLYDF